MQNISVIIGLVFGSLVFALAMKHFTIISFNGCWGYISVWFTCVALCGAILAPLLLTVFVKLGAFLLFLLIAGVFIIGVISVLGFLSKLRDEKQDDENEES